MKELVNEFSCVNRCMYQMSDYFNDETHIRFVLTSRQSETESCCNTSGYIIETSSNGEVSFYNSEGMLLAKADETQQNYEEVLIEMDRGCISVRFRCYRTIDYYPHCDGEHDRWGQKWVTLYRVCMDFDTNKLSTEMFDE